MDRPHDAGKCRLHRYGAVPGGAQCRLLENLDPDCRQPTTLPAPRRTRAPPRPSLKLHQLQSQRDAVLLDRLNFWNAGPPSYRWTSIAIPPGPANAILNTRIMSLLSIAIYDATVAAWDSKYTYNRRRPSDFDPTLTPAIANPNMPSYPSEHAVVAGAAFTVLSYLFPAKTDTFAAMADEAAQVWVRAGVNYPSDVKAGLDLGRAVGALVVDRAKQDGSDMTGPVEIPVGPCHWTGINPIAPFEGSVKTWVLSSGSQLRPGPPPDCRSTEGQAELAEVRDFPRTFDTNATAFYWQSYRSNWNNVIDQKIFEYRLDTNPPRAARVYAIASITAFDATVACWDAKYTYWAIRPFMLGATTIFRTPNPPKLSSRARLPIRGLLLGTCLRVPTRCGPAKRDG